jgi:hypothetical protein
MLEVVEGEWPTVDEGAGADVSTIRRPECGYEVEDEGVGVSASFINEGLGGFGGLVSAPAPAGIGNVEGAPSAIAAPHRSRIWQTSSASL